MRGGSSLYFVVQLRRASLVSPSFHTLHYKIRSDHHWVYLTYDKRIRSTIAIQRAAG